MQSLSNIGRLIYIDSLFLNYVWKCKECRLAKTTLKKKIKVGGLALPDSNLVQSHSNQ